MNFESNRNARTMLGKTQGRQCSKFPRILGLFRPLTPSKTRKFCAKNFFRENERILSDFSNVLIVRVLTKILKKNAAAGFQKSTPQKNLALTFENLACLQRAHLAQNLGKKCAQKPLLCAKKSFLGTFSRSPTLHK